MKTCDATQTMTGSRVRRAGLLCGSVALCCVTLCSCMSVKYDMRDLEQPVTLNRNPFACDAVSRPAMTPVDGFSAKLLVSMVAGPRPAGSPGSGPQQTHTVVNEPQTKAFEKIGGDESLTITDVRMETSSMGVNLGLMLGSRVDLTATGTVQKVDSVKNTKSEVTQ